ncbi:hypothetical protein AeMF1_010409 [Aphanomyces euteiches]|nr:hypothetical protein AeMF1_010409 [Aphanomyces euteiches]KAH9195994.1 hypothetical protein AeNC1_002034 [Aphanomyces euteiches]
MDREASAPQKPRRGNSSSHGGKQKNPNARPSNAPATARPTVNPPTILRPSHVNMTILSPDQPRLQMNPAAHQKLYEPSSHPSSPPNSILNAIPRNALQVAAARGKSSPNHGIIPSSSHSTADQPSATSLRGWKLVNSQWQFCADLPTASPWSDMTQYRVIGCVGMEGVGKSSILSMLCSSRRSDSSGTCSRCVFAECILNAKHQTNGIDMCITPDHVVFLDCQPLLSTSMLVDLTLKNESPKFGSLALDQQIEIQSLHQLVFLLSVCHCVIVAYEDVNDRALWQLFQTAELLKCRLPSISMDSPEHTAQLIVVANKQSSLLPVVEKRNHDVLRNYFKDYTLCLLPERRSDDASPSQDYQDAARPLQNHIARFPKAPTIFQKKNHISTFKEWLANSSRVFESIRKAQVMADYSRLLQKIAK